MIVKIGEISAQDMAISITLRSIPMAMSQRLLLVKVYAYFIRKSISLLT